MLVRTGQFHEDGRPKYPPTVVSDGKDMLVRTGRLLGLKYHPIVVSDGKDMLVRAFMELGWKYPPT